MPRIVIPKVFVLAETMVVSAGLGAFLQSGLGVEGWESDAESPAELLTEVAGKSCYLSFDKSLNKNLTRTGTRTNHEYIQEQIIKMRHGSVLEHATVTFAFVDVSRVFTHELVRHRAGTAFSQVSGRYVRSDDIGYFLPKVIADRPEAAGIFEEAFKTMEDWAADLARSVDIDNMKDFSLKKTLTSAFRRLIGNGQSNHIIFTANHRALRHIIHMRTSRGAEEEIRHVFAEVYRLCLARYPAIYSDALVTLVGGINEVSFAGHV